MPEPAARHGTRAVLFDFDGTLAPIVENPQAAVIHPDAPGVLVDLSAQVAAVAVLTGRPARQVLALGGLDEVGGEFTSGVERSVPFSVCGEGAPVVAEARAGPYVARGPAQVGGQNCYSAVRHRVFRFGVKPGVRTATVEALDVAPGNLMFYTSKQAFPQWTGSGFIGGMAAM